jgi:phosphohistidine phosphatase
MASAGRRLYLLRHAKSSWADPRLDDHERPLAPRGEEAVRRLSTHLGELADGPQLVLCSSARRTMMTLDGIAPSLPADVRIQIEDSLYGASDRRLLSRLRRVDDEVRGAMVIGHNPGLEDLAEVLVGSGDNTARQKMATKFPTAALATLTFAGSWVDLAPQAATLETFVVPRALST